jgi:hypothetical protein
MWSRQSSWICTLEAAMTFETLRSRFIEADKHITLDQFRALSETELEALIHEANLTRPERGQARIFHAPARPGKNRCNLTITY